MPPGTLDITLLSEPPAINNIVRVEPGATLTLTASLTTSAPLDGATLLLLVPGGWAVVDASGGLHDEAASTVAWALEPVPATSGTSRRVSLRAPDAQAATEMPAVSTFTARVTAGDTSVDGPELQVIVGPAVSISQVTAARAPGPGFNVEYLTPGEPLLDEPRYQVFRLRFEVLNSEASEYTWAPALEFATAADGFYSRLPAGTASAGVAFYAAPEWVRVAEGGTAMGPLLVTVPAVGEQPATWRSMGTNPITTVALAPSSISIIEFSVRATVDAAYGRGYYFRVTDDGAPFEGAPVANVVLELRPTTLLSPGQRDGVPAGPGAQEATRFGLNAPNLDPGAATSESIHGPSYTLASDVCAACHRAHIAAGSLITAEPTELALCSSCHNGVNAPDVSAAYAGAPANDPAARAYYQHDPTNGCTECHNPHDSSSIPAAPGSTGWAPSGRIGGASAVAATNGPGAVSYALIARSTLEYQLCFKCHSGYAPLPSNVGQPPSRHALDKGIELDPRNLSFHPIEGPGTNGTDQMAASLGGSSPYKLWNFTPASTIRCVNCHADARLVAAAAGQGQTLAADASLQIHASPQRGILIAPYLDRALKGPLEAYQAADFALCFVCHAEAAFRDTSGEQRPDTNFRFHGLHVSGESLINHGSDGTDIDRPGDGGGLATCAECHFRIHSSAFPVNGQSPGPRLVDFAPDVSGGTTTANWSPATATQEGTCALKCHGQPHVVSY